MIVDRLELADHYAAVHPGFAAAFAFLRSHDLAALPAGRNDIDGDRLYANVIDGECQPREKALLEAHQQYIDIHVTVAGVDNLGWRSTLECTQPKAEYNAEGDYVLYDDAIASWVAITPGAFAVCMPEDGHAPGVGEGKLRKVVMKIRMVW